MSAAGEAKPSQGPKVAASRDLERPTRGYFVRGGWRKEADQ